MWVDLGLINLVDAIMNGPQTLYELPAGSFLSQIRFADDPASVYPDFVDSGSTPLPWFNNVGGGYLWFAAGTEKSFGWNGFAGLGLTADGQNGIPGRSYDSTVLAATVAGPTGAQVGSGYGPFNAAGDYSAADFNSLVLSAASVGPIQAGLIFGQPPLGGLGVRIAAIRAWVAATSYDSPNNADNTNPGALQKCAILANGTIWINSGATGTSGGSSPDFAAHAGASVTDGADIVWADTTFAPPTVGKVHLVAEIVTPI